MLHFSYLVISKTLHTHTLFFTCYSSNQIYISLIEYLNSEILQIVLLCVIELA